MNENSRFSNDPDPEVLGLIVSCCDSFESDLLAGKNPAIEDYLTKIEEAHRTTLLEELLIVELQFHSNSNKPSSLDELIQRFPSEVDLVKRVYENEKSTRNRGVEGTVAPPVAKGYEVTAAPGELPDRVVDNVNDATYSHVANVGNIDPGNEATTGYESDASQGSLAPGKRFGDYELLNEIARGGMGVVYKARQISLNRTVALKMILSGELAGAEEVRRFYSEAESAAHLDHPGIVPVFEVGQYNEQHFLALAFVEGHSLREHVRKEPLSPVGAARMTQQISEAMGYAHNNGVIHRDLKPANILLDKHKDGIPRITDFGLAKNLRSDLELTQTGQIMGTPGYMPPEQALGNQKEITHLADIYSIGAILYALLVARPPFAAENAYETIKQVIGEEPAAPRVLNASIPQDIETICLKCLNKDRFKRYQSCEELSAELGRFIRGEPILARPVSRSERFWRWCKRNPQVAGLSAAVVSVLIIGIVVSSVLAVVATKEADRASKAEIAATDSATEAKLEAKAKEEARKEAVAAKNSALESFREARDAYFVLVEALKYEPYTEETQRRILDKIIADYQLFIKESGDEVAMDVERGFALYPHR